MHATAIMRRMSFKGGLLFMRVLEHSLL